MTIILREPAVERDGSSTGLSTDAFERHLGLGVALAIVLACTLCALTACGGSFDVDEAPPANCGADFVGPVTPSHPAPSCPSDVVTLPAAPSRERAL